MVTEIRPWPSALKQDADPVQCPCCASFQWHSRCFSRRTKCKMTKPWLAHSSQAHCRALKLLQKPLARWKAILTLITVKRKFKAVYKPIHYTHQVIDNVDLCSADPRLNKALSIGHMDTYKYCSWNHHLHYGPLHRKSDNFAPLDFQLKQLLSSSYKKHNSSFYWCPQEWHRLLLLWLFGEGENKVTDSSELMIWCWNYCDDAHTDSAGTFFLPLVPLNEQHHADSITKYTYVIPAKLSRRRFISPKQPEYAF